MKRTLIGFTMFLTAGIFALNVGAQSKINITSLVDPKAKISIAELDASLGAPVVPKNVKFAYVTRTLSNEFWGYERDGFEAEAKKLGVGYQTFDVVNESSITEQLDKAKIAYKQGYSALLASPIAATALDSVYKDAIKKGIPSFVLNDAQGTLPGVIYIGPDALAIGRTAADYIAKLLPNGGKVAMIEGDPGSSNSRNRGAGFKEQLAKYPNLTLVSSQTAMWDQNRAQTIANAIILANPDIKAFYSQNDVMAFGVEAALAAKGLTDKVILVGTDGIPQAKKEILAGKMTATVSEAPTSEGSTAVKAALWLLQGKKLPGWIEVPGFIIDKDNVAKYPVGMP
jgi:ABC-type sugar transport system substrate-binding protein